MVYNSLVDQKKATYFSNLSDKEMYYHLHVTTLHHGMTISKSRDMCEATGHVVNKSHEQHEVAVSTTKASFNESIRRVLSDHCDYNSHMIKLGDHLVKSVILIYACYLTHGLVVQHCIIRWYLPRIQLMTEPVICTIITPYKMPAMFMLPLLLLQCSLVQFVASPVPHMV